MILGEIEFEGYGEMQTATLTDKGWQHPDKALADYLDAFYGLDMGSDPSLGAYGAVCLVQAAKAMDGRITKNNTVAVDEIPQRK